MSVQRERSASVRQQNRNIQRSPPEPWTLRVQVYSQTIHKQKRCRSCTFRMQRKAFCSWRKRNNLEFSRSANAFKISLLLSISFHCGKKKMFLMDVNQWQRACLVCMMPLALQLNSTYNKKCQENDSGLEHIYIILDLGYNIVPHKGSEITLLD